MKKVSILTFAICLSCVVLAGCSGENSSKTESASSQSSETTEAGETKIVGYLGYWLVFDECSINNVGVVPELQGQGIGNLLMEKLIGETERFGARVWVLEVRAGNEPAIALYEKYGFNRTGVRRGYYENGEDAIVMLRQKN